MVEDLRAFDVPEAEVEDARVAFLTRAAPSDEFVVFGPNAAAVRLFQALRTQWRTASLSTMGRAEVVKTGLDYGVVQATAELRRLPLEGDTFDRLQVMEAEALTAWAEERRNA